MSGDKRGWECLALIAAVAGGRHHSCTNQGTVKRLGCTARGKNAKYIGILSLTHTRELALAPIGCPVGNPGILLAMLLEQSPVLPATMAGSRSFLPSDHGWFENDLRLTWHGPYN